MQTTETTCKWVSLLEERLNNNNSRNFSNYVITTICPFIRTIFTSLAY